ncbi:TolC family protein [Aureibacter tunicatorum]|uniref:Outer membrane protein TolC n=1 Tax=Aureibacter tunicatorum TaxID=866807 RepID=A0AAE4BSW5_9BACT|nr:TolC family protein [Aureibacter tunicatorum]MDR6238857.1 outer membrane protein TolC [Aureibacter tunicatorum]BDD05216.1 hypothetical protein AUTU_26990 [Aureibacter tunicatorum]
MLLKVLICLTFTLSYPMLAYPEGLNDYLKKAAMNNPGLKAEYKEFEQAMLELPKAKSWHDPKLSFGYFIDPVETRVGAQRASLFLSQTFPWFGTFSIKGDVAEEKALALFEKFIQSRNEVFFKVKKVYYELLKLHQTIIFQKQQLEIYNDILKLVSNKDDYGKEQQLDILRIQLKIDELLTQIKDNENKRPSLHFAFMCLLNDKKIKINYDENHLEKPDSTLINQIYTIQGNPMFSMIEHQENKAKALKKLAVKNGLPDLGISFAYIFTEKREDAPNLEHNGRDAILPMLSLSIPIYRKKYKAQKKQADLMFDQWKLEKKDLMNRLNTKKYRCIYEINSAWDNFRLYSKKYPAVMNMAKLQKELYLNSNQNYIEWQRLQEKALEYLLYELKARKMFWTCHAEIQFLTGHDSSKFLSEEQINWQQKK